MQVDWELSQTLTSLDGQGIRGACVLSSTSEGNDAFRLVIGTQGGGLAEYGVPSGNITPVAFQHNHAVTALLSSEKNRVYVTGCKDSVLRVFSASNHELQGTLEGHEKPATSLAWADESQTFLLSGSWDGTAKVWDIQRQALIATLPGHENSTCVVGLDKKGNILRVATGSAGIAQGNSISGHTLRIWSVDTVSGLTSILHQVANDHEGPIRGLALTAGSLVTCSNDGTIKLRSVENGSCSSTLGFIAENSQHPPMLLNVAAVNNSSYVVACAEDGHVVIWGMDQDCEPQLVTHSSCVWNIVPLPNGDFATCGDDGNLRIFTQSTARFAEKEVREAFAVEVAQARQKKSGGPSPEEVAKLPPWETNLQVRGASEGQVQLFRKNGIAIAAQWSMSSQTWIEVGQVVGNNDSSAGQINGVSYDNVYPIEVDQAGGGVAKLEIGYNNGENPFTAAQRFIDAHMLPQNHLAEIADYIQQRSGTAAPTLGSVPTGSATAPMVAYEHLPSRAYKSFDLTPKTAATVLTKLKAKLNEFGALTEAGQAETMETLSTTLLATNRYHSSKIADAELKLITQLLEKLPPDQSFPVLDLARMCAMHPDATSQSRSTHWKTIVTRALSIPDTTNGPAVPMLTLRIAANALRGGAGSREAVVANPTLETVVSYAQRHVASDNKNVRLSVATFLFNTCHFFVSGTTRPTAKMAQSLVALGDVIVSNNQYEEEALFRAMQGVGSLALTVPEAKEAAKVLTLKVEPAACRLGGAACKALAKEVYAVLQ